MRWPRFLWTPHCPLEPRRNGPHTVCKFVSGRCSPSQCVLERPVLSPYRPANPNDVFQVCFAKSREAEPLALAHVNSLPQRPTPDKLPIDLGKARDLRVGCEPFCRTDVVRAQASGH
jgi:hypothetical protein